MLNAMKLIIQKERLVKANNAKDVPKLLSILSSMSLNDLRNDEMLRYLKSAIKDYYGPQSINIVELYLQKGISPNIDLVHENEGKRYHHTMLTLSLLDSNLEMCKLLIQKGASTRVFNKRKNNDFYTNVLDVLFSNRHLNYDTMFNLSKLILDSGINVKDYEDYYDAESMYNPLNQCLLYCKNNASDNTYHKEPSQSDFAIFDLFIQKGFSSQKAFDYKSIQIKLSTLNYYLRNLKNKESDKHTTQQLKLGFYEIHTLLKNGVQLHQKDQKSFKELCLVLFDEDYYNQLINNITITDGSNIVHKITKHRQSSSFDYENHCWKCKTTVNSDSNERCPDCGWFICSKCGECGCNYTE